jgi:hypothetical protein
MFLFLDQQEDISPPVDRGIRTSFHSLGSPRLDDATTIPPRH